MGQREGMEAVKRALSKLRRGEAPEVPVKEPAVGEPKPRRIEVPSELPEPHRTEVPSELPTTDILDRLDPASLVERKVFRNLLANVSMLKFFTSENLVRKSGYPERVVMTFCNRMVTKGFASEQDGSYNLKVKVL